jgi:ABC-type multidrug transport system fused ATPase/permease subunit
VSLGLATLIVVSTFLINTVVQGALLWFGTRLIEEHKLTPGILLAFMLYQSQLQNETLSLMNSYTSLIKSSGAGDKVFALLDRSPPPPSTGSALESTMRLSETSLTHRTREELTSYQRLETDDVERGSTIDARRFDEHQYEVKLEDISFAYPSRPDNPVLVGLTLDIPKGQTVALVGKSGCGKTTIVNLLQRFYDPTAGRVLINGTDLRELDLMNHRRRIGVVTQDPALFRGTLRENIIYGCCHGGVTRDSATEMEMVQRAARLAHADVFIQNFPCCYETTVGDRGVQLSGGQKQRIGKVHLDFGCTANLILHLVAHSFCYPYTSLSLLFSHCSSCGFAFALPADSGRGHVVFGLRIRDCRSRGLGRAARTAQHDDHCHCASFAHRQECRQDCRFGQGPSD